VSQFVEESPAKTKKLDVLSDTRSCGECSACCWYAAVLELKKSSHTECRHACRSTAGSCSIFGKDERPKVCQTFQCSWLYGLGSDEHRPDKTGLLCSTNNLDGESFTFGLAVELRPDAVTTSGRDFILAFAAAVSFPIIVVNYGSPVDSTGDRLIVKDSLLSKTQRMRGDLVSQIGEGVWLHDLIKERVS